MTNGKTSSMIQLLSDTKYLYSDDLCIWLFKLGLMQYFIFLKLLRQRLPDLSKLCLLDSVNTQIIWLKLKKLNLQNQTQQGSRLFQKTSLLSCHTNIQ